METEVRFTVHVHMRVLLTQSGELLADSPCIRLCRTCTYVAPAEGETSVANTVGKDLKQGNGVRNVLEEDVDSETGTEIDSLSPDFLVRLALLRNDYGDNLVLDSAEIRLELISGQRVESVQDVGCGYLEFK